MVVAPKAAGANGFDRGSLALGGAIDYITHTGYTAPKLQLRYEAGSDGYQKRNMSAPAGAGRFRLLPRPHRQSHRRLSGSRRRAKPRASSPTSAIAQPETWRRASTCATARPDNELAGRVTKDSIEHDPRSANPPTRRAMPTATSPAAPGWATRPPGRSTTIRRIQAGLVYHDYPMDLREGPNRLKVAYTDVSGTLNYKRRDTLWGLQSQSTTGLRVTNHLPNAGASEQVRIPHRQHRRLRAGHAHSRLHLSGFGHRAARGQ